MNFEDIFSSVDLTLGEAIFALVVLIVGIFLARWARRLTRRYLQRFPHLPSYMPQTAARIAGWLVVLSTLVVVLSILGFDLGPVLIVMLILVAVFVLAGRPLLENFGSGIILQTRSAFLPGDRVETNGFEGYVEEVNVRAVVIRTYDGRVVHIPNTDVLSNPISNLSTARTRRSTLEVGVAYGTDLDLAHQVLVEAASSADGVLGDPEPEAQAREFGDSSINFSVYYWHDESVWRETTDSVARTIKRDLDAAGIEIPFPQRDVHMREG